MSERNETVDMFYADDSSLRSTYVSAIADAVSQIGDREGWTPGERDDTLTSLSRDFSDAKLTSDAASIIADHIAKGYRSPPTEAMLDEWAMSTRSALRAKYGSDTEAESRLSMIGEYVRARPRLMKLMTDSGASAHPEVLAILADKANRGSAYSMIVQPRKVKTNTHLGGK